MKSVFKFLALGLFFSLLVFITLFYTILFSEAAAESRVAKLELKKGRSEYFTKMLADPLTGKIPANIRQKELVFARDLDRRAKLFKQAKQINYNWKEAGPNDVGGRTRALAIDLTNPEVIIAGGVSGGIWKSSDHGETWELKNTPDQVLSVTSIAQDPRPGYTNIWYYTSGEQVASSASATGAGFYGGGFYKSEDNGETWENIIPKGNFTVWTDPFDISNKVMVDETGNVYLACGGFGILKSTDGGNSFDIILGKTDQSDGFYVYSDFDISPGGRIVATLSSANWGSTQLNSPGIYYSENYGTEWENITPADFPIETRRSVIDICHSNPDICYIFTHTGLSDEDKYSLYRINLSTKEADERKENIPDFSEIFNLGYMNTQGDYNMVVSAKPDDENFVLLGGTNLFRSTDGFATRPSDIKECWIGGYAQDEEGGSLVNHHADQHLILFENENPNRVWSSHDGGISFAQDISAAVGNNIFNWENKNNSYNVTQFYTVDIPDTEGDNRIVGGAQDNGSPYFLFDGMTTSVSNDVSSGDGSTCYWGEDNVYVSAQRGKIVRIGIAADNDELRSPFYGTPPSDWAVVHPEGASNQLFVNPFAVNLSNDKVMYYPSGNELWYNLDLTPIENEDWDGTADGWQKVDSLILPDGYFFSAATAAKKNQDAVLYILATYLGSERSSPKLFKFDIANEIPVLESTFPLPGKSNNSFAHCIAVNPDNIDELIIVMTNYNVDGTYYSNDGGKQIHSIEGNLLGTAQNPGPSIRSAAIVSTGAGTKYLLGTSIGLYSTEIVDGASTIWKNESPDQLGNVIVSDIDTRVSDHKIVAATHGRGMFAGTIDPTVGINDRDTPSQFMLEQNYPNPFNPETTIRYSVGTATDVTLNVFNINGELIHTLVNEHKPAGQYSIKWDGKNQSGKKVASGIYFYQLGTTYSIISKKMILLK